MLNEIIWLSILVFGFYIIYNYLSWKYPLQTAFYGFLIRGILQGKGKVK